MDGFLEHQLICRACLRIVENKTQSFGYIEDVNGNLKDMIMCCVPEMDIYVSSHPIMCFPCIQLLITVYNFKTRCLNTETIIRSYIQRNNLIDYNHVNLSCVVQELIRLNSYFRDMQNRHRQDMEHSHNAPAGNQCGAPRNPCVPGYQHGMPGHPSGIPGNPGSIPGNPGSIPGNPGGIPGNPGGIPGNPGGIPGNPGGIPGDAGGISGNPGSIPVNPGGIPESPGGVPGSPDGVPGNPGSAPGSPSDVPENPGGISENSGDMPHNPSGIPENSEGMPRSPGGMPGTPGGMPGNPGGMPGNPGGMPRNPGGMSGNPGDMPQNPVGIPRNPGMPAFHSGIPPVNQAGVPGNLNGWPGNQGGVPINQRGVPINQRGVPINHIDTFGSHRVTPLTRFPGNHYGPPINQMGIPGPQFAAPRQQGGVPVNPREFLINHCCVPGNQMIARSDYLPLTREEINAAPPVADDKNGTEDMNYDGHPMENHGPIVNDKIEVQPIETRMRLVIKIDKGKVSLPYNTNEDLNEKENEQQDVEMNEKEMPLPENGSLMHPPPQNNKQELYECANCTFVTTHHNFLLAHNTVCISEHEKIDLKKCPHCPHVTNRQYALNKHINTMHTKAIWYSCDLCNYRSTDSSCLRRHKRNVHPEVTGNEQLCCHLCAYRCTTEYHLRKHLLKHEENTVLQCQFCSYSTKDRSNFRKHIFIHNPKAQDCEFCDYKCVSPYQMKVHLRKYHHGVGMEDIDCRSEVSISEVVDDITAAINETQTYIGHQAE